MSWRLTPAPASSSRQRPAESASVTSTVSLLKAIRFERSPATVTNAPLPPVPDTRPTWARAAALARDWELNNLADRLQQLAEKA